MRNNILSSFKKELGYINATNQYLELAVRITERDYKDKLKKDLRKLADEVELKVSTINDDYRCRISKSYIISINSCFENFLKNFRDLPGSPTNITQKGKNKDQSWLEWTVDTAYLDLKNGIKNDYAICDYYRLLRNDIIHYGEISSTIKNKKALIKRDRNQQLQAPNDFNSLSFDDQVLFSRAALNVAKFIFNNSKYDINTIISSHKNELTRLVMPLKEPCSRNRASNKVKRFLNGLYPELLNVNWEEAINTLFI